MPDLLFEMNTGISGDMILGGLFDLGLDFTKWKAQIKKLKLEKVSISKREKTINGIKGVKVKITAPPENSRRTLKNIKTIIKKANFSGEIEKRAVEILTRVAQAEAKVHGCDIESVHFHEIGAVDSIVDIVGACIGFHMLKIKKFYATPLVFGYGEVSTAHGHIPVPCPATLELSKSFPSRRRNIESELSTPTGTAIVTTLAEPVNNAATHTINQIGYGCGSKQFKDSPNVLRLSLISGKLMVPVEPDETICQIECNLDDMSPEILGFVTGRLLEAGCQDVWQEPIYMKKNRGAIKLCALCKSITLNEILLTIVKETSTGGIRYFPVNRVVAEKKSRTVTTRYGKIRVKAIDFKRNLDNTSRITPEYEDCCRIAQKKKIPLNAVYSEVSSCLSRKKYE